MVCGMRQTPEALEGGEMWVSEWGSLLRDAMKLEFGLLWLF